MQHSLTISTSLFGGQKKYTDGAKQCANELSELNQQLKIPVRLAVYYDRTTPPHALHELTLYADVELIQASHSLDGRGTAGSTYRFHAFNDFHRKTSIILTWDLDNTLIDGFAAQLVDIAISGNAVFYMMRKDDPPQQRRYNADCWLAVPARCEFYGDICRTLADHLDSYFEKTGDFEYGCDERFQTRYAKHLLTLSNEDCRVLCSLRETITHSQTSTSLYYANTQRMEIV